MLKDFPSCNRYYLKNILSELLYDILEIFVIVTNSTFAFMLDLVFAWFSQTSAVLKF